MKFNMCNERNLDSVYSRKEKSRPFSVETIKDRRPIRPIGPKTRKKGGCFHAHVQSPLFGSVQNKKIKMNSYIISNIT